MSKNRNTSQLRQVHPRNMLNSLPGRRWLYFTRSILKTDYDKSIGYKLRELHGASKPPQLMKEIIEFFTNENEMVLDGFSGVGSTLLAASLCNRRAIGIEINEKWVSVYKNVCETEDLKQHDVYVGDCIEILEKYKKRWQKRFQLILTDPPYGPNLDRTMCNGKYPNHNRISTYEGCSTFQKDLGNSKSLDEYFDSMLSFLGSAYQVLQDNRYLVLITRNCYKDGEYIMVVSHLANIAKRQGFTLKGEIIWHQNGTRLRPYGYPFVFVPNIIHHNILVLRKEVST